MPTGFKYFAFISYGRKDSKAAAWLQKRLEWFRFPVKLVPEDRRPPNARFVRPIYRDKTNLEVTDEHYWTNIRRALLESRYLIVLCSPHAAASEPVNMEVTHFLATHGGDASLVAPVIVSGNVTSVGDDAALCPALRALGDLLINRNLPTMVPDAVTAEQDAWEQGFVSLVSYLLQLERSALGDHIRREERRQLARNRALTAAFAMLALVAIAGGIIAWLQRSAALEAKREVEKANVVIEKRNREITEKNAINLKNLNEASMADYAVAVQRIEKDGKWHEGVAHLVRSLKWWPENPLATALLYSTISLYGSEKQSWPRQVIQHEDRVQSARFSPDGTRIIASWGKTAQVWDAVSGKPLGGPLRHERTVFNAQFNSDGKRIVTISGDLAGSKGEARVWDATTGEPVGEPLRHENVVISAQFSPDSARVVTASADKTARVWEAASGKPIGMTLRHEDAVISAQFSPDGARVVTASADKTARVWDATGGNPIGEPLHHSGSVGSAQFSPDGARIVTTSTDLGRSKGEARIWDAVSGKPLWDPLRHEHRIYRAEFSPDGTRIVTAGEGVAGYNGEARVWEAASGKPIGEPLGHGLPVQNAQFSPDGTRIVTASWDRTARVWDAANGKPVGEPLRHEGIVNSAHFSPDGMRIVTASEDKTVRVWDAPGRIPYGEPLRHGGWVITAQYSSDGTRIVTGSSDKTARVWDVTSGKTLAMLLIHGGVVRSVQFSPDGTRIVTAGDDKTARVWDAASGKPVGEPLPHGDIVWNAQFSPDGTRILTASHDKTARVWDAASGKPLGKPLLHEGAVRSAQFSPDGTRIVTAGDDKTARVWDSASGNPVGEPLPHGDIVYSAQFSPDGMRIVTASVDWNARVWDAASGKPLGEQLRHTGGVSCARFSADGTRIVTTEAHTLQSKGDVLVWDAVTGRTIGELLHHEDSVYSAQFSPDGRHIVTASYGGTALIWDNPAPKDLPTPVPEWVLTRAIAIAGLGFDGDGKMREVHPEARRAVLLEPLQGNDAWIRLARWLAQPANERTLTPDSKFTCRQIAERERDSGFKEGIESALRYDPTVPLAHVLLTKFEKNPQRADFLRGYGLKLLPDDATLWARAAASLVEQKDFKRALQAADKAMALDAKNADALQARAAAVEGMKSKTLTQ